MIKKYSINKTKVKSNFSDALLRSIGKIPEIKECEYVYIDYICIQCIQSKFLHDKFVITQDTSNDYLIFDIEDVEDSGQINNVTKLESNHVVDLVILSNDIISNDIESFIDQDTIITKDLGNNVVYMKDQRNNVCIFITDYEQFIIKGDGVKTEMLYYESFNT